MNCNDAFEYMTNSNLRNSNELRVHLQNCSRCRQMSLVLEPALALFDPPPEPWSPQAAAASSDVLSPEELGPPPEPFLSPDTVRLAERAAKALLDQETRYCSRRRWRLATGLACAAAGLMIAAVVVTGLRRDANANTAKALSQPTLPRQCTWRNSDQGQVTGAANAKLVVLSCVACHLADDATLRSVPKEKNLDELTEKRG